MKFNKRFIALALVAALALVMLCACGQGNVGQQNTISDSASSLIGITSTTYETNDTEYDIEELFIFKIQAEDAYTVYPKTSDLPANLVIPSEYKGLPVTIVKGFSKIDSIETVVLPPSIREIGAHAFKKCMNLKSVTISGELVKISDEAFYGCLCLKSINIPDSVIYLGALAFAGCARLESITLPSNAETSSGAFGGCDRLDTVIVNEGRTILPYLLFEYCAIKSIVIPASVKKIVRLCFYRCDNLTTVYYTGTEEQWNAIEIDEGNDALLNAKKVFNYKP